MLGAGWLHSALSSPRLPLFCGEMAQLQENINGIIAVFCTYARDCRTLSRGELRQLIEREFGDVITDARDPRTVEEVFLFLDEDSSGKVDFDEFLTLVSRVAKACHRQLQQYLESEYDQELAQEEAGRNQDHKQVLEQRVSKQEGEQPQRDWYTQQHKKGEEPKNHQDTQKKQEGGTPKNQHTKKSETPKVHDTQKIQEVETPKYNQGTQQKQKSEKPKDNQDIHQAKTLEEHPKRGENVVPEISEKDRNIPRAEKTPKHDPKPHQEKVIETPKLGQNPHQRQELEPIEQSHISLTKPPGRTTDKTKDHAAPSQDPSPRGTQELPPPARGTSPYSDPRPSGTQHHPAHLPDPTVIVLEGSGYEAEHVPGEQRHGAHGKGKHGAEQEHLKSQWPPQN